MYFMNEYEVQEHAQRYGHEPVMGAATRTLSNLMHWTNSNSDGWAYWPKPCRAAAKLMRMIDDHATWERTEYRHPREGAEATAEAYRKAVAPIKAFRTRQGASFEIVAL